MISATKLSDYIQCPRWSQNAVLAVTTAAATFDLRTLGPQIAHNDLAGGAEKIAGAADHYVTLQADGGDVYVVFATLSTQADDLVVATNGTNQISGCVKIPNGTQMNVIPAHGVDVFVGYLTAAGTAQLRIWMSSPLA